MNIREDIKKAFQEFKNEVKQGSIQKKTWLYIKEKSYGNYKDAGGNEKLVIKSKRKENITLVSFRQWVHFMRAFKFDACVSC